MNISISKEIKEKIPDAALGVIRFSAVIEKSPEELVGRFDQIIERIGSEYETKDIVNIPHIAPTRRAYKALGKDPHSYRSAAEQMLRRIILKKGLYFVNNAVDINNIISVTSGYSIGTYDLSKVSGDITLMRAPDGTHYKGIGKDSYEYNVEFLPALFDDEGCFGNPSSDSQRTMLKPGEREAIFVFYAFDGTDGLEFRMDEAESLLAQYCPEYRTIERLIIK